MTNKKTNNQTRRRMYECEECHARRFVAWIELNRASRPKCMGCGSVRLELVTEEAKEERANLNQERIAGTGGSLKLANENNQRHKVT